MPFHSLQYCLFYLVTLSLFWLLRRAPLLRLAMLLVASYYFYISNNHYLILLILLSTQIDYVAGLKIGGSNDRLVRKGYLLFSLISNLGILFFFKYFTFLTDTGITVANQLGGHLQPRVFSVSLPVGISFYTFQSMSYTLDVYRRRIEPERSWLRFALFVAYFPQLVAGPIVRARSFLPQLQAKPAVSTMKIDRAVFLIVLGLFKKVVLGDFLAVWVDRAFSHPLEQSALLNWLGVYAFAFQIYFDFSGYTDLARGCAKLMGFELPVNFKRPYVATSPADFWRRWHISLSTWLRDYLYIPLGGNRVKTRGLVYRNLAITMLLGGLWHGAAWPFVIWGTYHALLLIIQKKYFPGVDRGRAAKTTGQMLARLITFHLILISWILFRVESLRLLPALARGLFGNLQPTVLTLEFFMVLMILLGAFAVQLVGEKLPVERRFRAWPLWLKAIIYTLLISAVIVFSAFDSQPFIYFKF